MGLLPSARSKTHSRRLACGTRPSATPSHTRPCSIPSSIPAALAAFPRFVGAPSDPAALHRARSGVSGRALPRRSDVGQLTRAFACLAALCWSYGCAREVIPNTHVEDTTRNRKVLEFVENYRLAVEARDAASLLALTSRNYFDDMGTPRGDDDVDYDTLRDGLERMKHEVLAARYQISYRGLTYLPDRVLVDVLYTGWFRVSTPDGPHWERRLEPHRLVLASEQGQYKLVSGM